jgi:FMN phosphatase YigB (HAD superfamily)
VYDAGVSRLALFDLDGTLIAGPDVPCRIAMGEFVAEHGLDPDLVTWLTETAGSWSESPISYFGMVAARYGVAVSPDELYAVYRARYLAAVRPLDGVLAGLARLRAAGWRTAVVTNGPAGPQLAKTEQLRLSRLMDAICVSEVEGFDKPDAAIFRRAAAKAGAALDGAWMVGDSLDADIAGGNALGLTTAWVSNGRQLPVAGPVPTHVLATTADVFDLILGS